MRLGWVWTGVVRGLGLGLRFFLRCLGVLVTRKDVENGYVEEKGFKLGFRVLEKKKRQAMNPNQKSESSTVIGVFVR